MQLRHAAGTEEQGHGFPELCLPDGLKKRKLKWGTEESRVAGGWEGENKAGKEKSL